MQSKSLVLAIDDEPSIIELVQRALGQAGYEVVAASNGSEALGLVEQRKPDLALLDIDIPGKSSMEVLEELRSGYPDVAVIVTTVVADVNIAIKALTEGACGYLNKPFNLKELVLGVERALEGRRLALQNREYQTRLEKKVNEQTQALQQKIRELTGLNNLFVRYLNEGFETADRYSLLAGDIMKASEEIQALAKEARALRVRVEDSFGMIDNPSKE
ncbi:MAG: response regulator [Chloroflexi bacterium]|nr:response regulator [Chloroflexota bacterium]